MLGGPGFQHAKVYLVGLIAKKMSLLDFEVFFVKYLKRLFDPGGLVPLVQDAIRDMEDFLNVGSAVS